MSSARISRAVWIALVCVTAAVAAEREGGLQVKRVVGLEYPWLANLAGVQGKVTLLALIAGDGTVQEVTAVSGPELLRGSAKATLSRWLFTGCTATAAPCKLTVTFAFVLDGKCDVARCATEFVADLPGAAVVRTKAAPAIID